MLPIPENDSYADPRLPARRRAPRMGRGLRWALAMVAVPALLSASASFAADCNADIGVLMKKRQDIIDQLNKQAKASPKGQLDPAVACGKLKSLAAAEREILGYLTKNKDWCMVPDSAITGIETSSKRSQSMAGNACRVAEQVKKGQEAIVNQGPKLPTGPL